MQQDPPQVGPTPPQQPLQPPQRQRFEPQQQAAPQPLQPQQNGFYQPSQPSAYVAPPSEPYLQPPASADRPFNDADAEGSISWEASEYIHNAKGASWLVGYIAFMAALLALAIWMQVWTFIILVVVMGAVMGYFAFRKPHIMQYRLTAGGIQINDKIYSYADFRAFGILREGAFFSLTLMPVKRMSPGVSLYFAQDDGEKIVDIIGQHLPMETIKPSPIDNLMQRLRF